MMKYLKPLLIIFSFLFTLPMFAQTEQGNFMFNGGIDVYRTDNNPFQVFKRIGAGIDANYFVADKLSFGIGWGLNAQTGGTPANHWGPSLRYYPFGTFFLRSKVQTQGFFRQGTVDLLLGMGYNVFIDNAEHWSLEINADYYLIRVKGFGFRLGFAWFI